MKVIKLFEEFNEEDLKDLYRDIYMSELEKLITFKDLYDIDVESWANVIQKVSPGDLDFDEQSISRREYASLLKEYKKISKNNQKLHLLNDFMIGLNGIGADYDYEDLDDKPIEFWIEEFEVSPKIASMMKSLHDGIDYPIISSDILNKQIQENPESTIIKLKNLWNNPLFQDTKKDLIIPSRFKEDADLLGDLTDLGF